MKTILISRGLLIGVFLVCTLGSCSGWQMDIPKTNIPEYASATYLPSTSTPRSTFSPITVTLIPSKPTNFTLTPTITFSPALLPTALPTLGAAEAEKMLQFMLYQNGGCELPCWWGITPGITRRDDMINGMRTILKKVESDEITYLDASGTEEIATRTIIFSNPKDETEYIGVLSVDGVVKSIKIGEYLTGQFSLPVLLRKYGKPQRILLATEPDSPNGTVPFHLILYYPDQGILAYFSSSYGGRIKGDYVYICPQYTLPMLQLWSSGDLQQGELEMKLLLENEGFYYNKYKSIEMVTDLSLEEFHAIFQQKNNTACIATEAEQWWNK